MHHLNLKRTNNISKHKERGESSKDHKEARLKARDKELILIVI